MDCEQPSVGPKGLGQGARLGLEAQKQEIQRGLRLREQDLNQWTKAASLQPEKSGAEAKSAEDSTEGQNRGSSNTCEARL